MHPLAMGAFAVAIQGAISAVDPLSMQMPP